MEKTIQIFHLNINVNYMAITEKYPT